MSSLYRSEEMALCQLFISSEAAYDSVSAIGEIGLVQFQDLNESTSAFQRRFVNEVRRCEDMERRLKYLETEIKKDEIKIDDKGDNPPAPQPKEIINLETIFEKFETELKEVTRNAVSLKRNLLELTELHYVLKMKKFYLAKKNEENLSGDLTDHLIPMEEAKTSQELRQVTGVISREKLPGFERLLWRVSRGNAYLREHDIPVPIEDPVTGDKIQKVSFLILFQSNLLKSKVNRICEALKATIYPCPEEVVEIEQMLAGVKTRIADLTLILNETNVHRSQILTSIAKHIRQWFIEVRKMRGIYHTFNMFSVDITAKCFIAECWIPLLDIPGIHSALLQAQKMSGSSIEPIIHQLDTTEAPPTFHRVNKFTKAYQKLIDSYGVATYREINPALYTIATFPFLFAIMFGDAGHGIILFLFALWMVLKEKQIGTWKREEMFDMLFAGRYIILMMGLFSIYTGSVYNDMFSKSFSVGGSSFHVGSIAQEDILTYNTPEYMLDPGNDEDYEGKPIPFGMDPIWQLAINKINYLNSFKMKLSIIIGVLQMIFGIVLSLFNSLYFKKTLNILFEFIPQMIFLNFLFGYLCVMVLYKWFNYGPGGDFASDGDVQHGSSCAPSVLILFIDMALFKKEPTPEPPTCGNITACPPCESAYLFNGQYSLQKYLVIIAVLMVPLMLIPKPFMLKRKMMRERALANQVTQNNKLDEAGTSSSPKPISSSKQHEEDEEGEIYLHQGIHTIEFVLGCVSHTASYLRLWALSLAHAQLAEVLWMMVMRIGLQQSGKIGSIVLYCIFAFWSFLTIAILVIMEGLSAFLHCLRLHWVEFCSKFYEREGYLFTPFKFKHFVNVDDD